MPCIFASSDIVFMRPHARLCSRILATAPVHTYLYTADRYRRVHEIYEMLAVRGREWCINEAPEIHILDNCVLLPAL